MTSPNIIAWRSNIGLRGRPCCGVSLATTSSGTSHLPCLCHASAYSSTAGAPTSTQWLVGEGGTQSQPTTPHTAFSPPACSLTISLIGQVQHRGNSVSSLSQSHSGKSSKRHSIPTAGATKRTKRQGKSTNHKDDNASVDDKHDEEADVLPVTDAGMCGLD